MDQPQEYSGDPRRTVVLSTVVKALPVIVGVAAIGGAAGILLSDRLPEEYTSSTSIILQDSRDFDPLGSQGVTQASRYVTNQIEFIRSRDVLERAATGLADGTTVGDLRSSLEVEDVDGADVIVLTTTGPTGEDAQRRGQYIAYAYEDEQREFVQSVARAASSAAATSAEATAASVIADGGTPAEAAAAAAGDTTLVAEIARRAAIYGDGVRSIPATDVPTEPTAPNPLRNGFLLAALGALLTTAVAIWRRGQPLADRGALVENAGAPLLGVVPVPLRRLLPLRPPLPRGQDFAMPLVALGYAVTSTSGVVMITGVRRDSGAATVALGFAAAAADQHQRVVVIDADTRDRALTGRSGVERPTLSVGALADPVTPTAHALVEVPDLRSLTGPGTVHVASLTGGGDTGAESVRRGLQRLVDSFDVIIVHAGPVATDPVAFALLRETAALVAVVDERSRTGDLVALREKLGLAGAACDGLVLARPASMRRRRPMRPAPEPGVTGSPATPAGAQVAGFDGTSAADGPEPAARGAGTQSGPSPAGPRGSTSR